MRYVVTALLVLGLGITALVPVASAQVNVIPSSPFTNQYGNQIVPLAPGGGRLAMCAAADCCTGSKKGGGLHGR